MKTHGVDLAQALNWVNLHLKANPQAEKIKVVEAAAMKYGLGPMDEDWLFREVSRRSSSATTDRKPSSQ